MEGGGKAGAPPKKSQPEKNREKNKEKINKIKKINQNYHTMLFTSESKPGLWIFFIFKKKSKKSDFFYLNQIFFI